MSGVLRETPSQTAGPFVHIGSNPNWADIAGVWPSDLGSAMLSPQISGERILITGRVFDGAGALLTDVLVEIWQADAQGRYGTDPDFSGWGRQPADPASGEFRFATIRPGPVPLVDGRLLAPHVTVWIVARGINLGLITRLYFPDAAEENANDLVLLGVPAPRRGTLLAARAADADGMAHYVFDIYLQGPDETVFFDA